MPPEISSAEADEISDTAFAHRRCCFCIPYGANGVGSVWWRRIESSDPVRIGENGAVGNLGCGGDERWWMRGWMRIREWSELVAGPKWKTFIRQFNRNHHRHGKGAAKFQKYNYDPHSYAMNFDEGPGQNSQFNEDDFKMDFSSRFASLPSSAKSSMDLGRDSAHFT